MQEATRFTSGSLASMVPGSAAAISRSVTPAITSAVRSVASDEVTETQGYEAFAPNSVQRYIAECLKVPYAHTPRGSDKGGVYNAYQRWRAVDAAQAKIDALISEGKWDGAKPSSEAIKKVFFGRTSHHDWNKVFVKAVEHPLLLDFLEQCGGVDSKHKMWHGRKPTQMVISEVADELAALAAKVEKGKGKGKAQVEAKSGKGGASSSKARKGKATAK